MAGLGGSFDSGMGGGNGRNAHGFQASASGLLLRDRVYARASYDWASGYVRYQGYTQSGRPVPSTVSGAVISDYSVRLGAPFPERSVMAVPFFEYGHHAWRRMVGVGTGQAYEEDYQKAA